ncbi:YfjI family protein [Halomonas sp. LBP4]|uniref:YfjI family protein n=1 Tax=Halomonas sp. LBP4 TaxID=2044917 RepID=UPI000D762FF8|nr:YfjI family protein [Halomonas sp. LBP4]PXY00362.1 hypothetical protein CR157_06430 [Halomonas sp. LBP4]
MDEFSEGETDDSVVPPDEHSEILFDNETSDWPCYKEDSIFESTVVELATSLEVSDEMARTSLLGVMATVCEGLVDVEYDNGHRLPVSLMTLTIADSGERKSATDSWAIQPLKEFEILKEKEVREKKNIAHRLYKNWEVKIKALEKSLTKATIDEADTGEIQKIENHLLELHSKRPELPRDIVLIYENVTPVALANALYKNFPYACLSSSEAGNLFNGQTFRDLYIFNSIYTGSSLTFDRSSSPSFTLHNPRLTLSLMLQPTAIERFVERKGREAHGSGFFYRFLIVKPREMAGRRTGDMPAVPEEVKNAYYGRVKELISRSVEIFERGEERRNIKLSPTAKKLWRKQFRSIDSKSLKGGIYHHAKGHASRLMENISRVAGIIHTFEGYEGDISSSTLEYAYSLCLKYSQHYMKNLAEEPEIVKLTNQMVRDIRKSAEVTPDGSGFTFHKSLFQQYGHPKLRFIEARTLAFDMLTKLGHLRRPAHSRDIYQFKNTVWTDFNPEIKNGEEYYISELPLWKDQEVRSKDGHANVPPYFAIKSTDKKSY